MVNAFWKILPPPPTLYPWNHRLPVGHCWVDYRGRGRWLGWCLYTSLISFWLFVPNCQIETESKLSFLLFTSEVFLFIYIFNGNKTHWLYSFFTSVGNVDMQPNCFFLQFWVAVKWLSFVVMYLRWNVSLIFQASFTYFFKFNFFFY